MGCQEEGILSAAAENSASAAAFAKATACQIILAAS